MKFWRSRRAVALVVIVVLLALFLVRPGVNRMRAQIVQSISLAVGRPVEVGWVKLRMFPRPGFELDNLVVHDDPAFSAEPLLRSQEVTAILRLRSLFRGRLEIARLNLTEPSLNLVRNQEGRWNVEALLERTSKIAVAPTGNSGFGKRPRFPYIELDTGRINLKLGAEKTPYALTDADLSFWQESENAWGVRLKATPMRSDLNLTDTGILRLEGSWLRAVNMRDTPLRFLGRWQDGQLGQATKLFYGVDKGWRGTLATSLAFTGTPGNLTVTANAAVEDLRRYDVLGGGSLDLAANCSAHFSSADHEISGLLCKAPVGDGDLQLQGDASLLSEPSQYDLGFSADMPTQAMASLLRHVRNGVPDDLSASGRFKMLLKFVPDNGGAAVIDGGGRASDLRLASDSSGLDLLVGDVPLTIASATGNQRTKKAPIRKTGQKLDDSVLAFGPIPVTLGKGETASVHGTLSRKQYTVALQGTADLAAVLLALRAVGIPSKPIKAEGKAKVDLQMAGEWSGERPESSGKVQISSVRAHPAGLNQPITIATANLLFSPDRIDVQDLRAFAAGAVLGGTLSLPRHCEIEDCPTTFNLKADHIALDQLNALLNPAAAKQPWYQALTSGSGGSQYLLGLHAVGKISAGQFLSRGVEANHVTANVELKNGKLQVSNLQADIWGGKHVGGWTADFAAKPPEYNGSGTLQHVALNELARLMNDGWITGSASATYTVSASGLSASDLFSSARANLQVNAQEGQLPHLVLRGETSLPWRKLSARLVLQDGTFKVQDGQLETTAETYQFSGTARPGRTLNFILTRNGAPAFNVTGTLEKPRVEAISETQAALKP